MDLVRFIIILGIALFAQTPVRQLLLQNRLDEALGVCRQYEVLGTSDQDNNLACAWVYYRTEKNGQAEKLLERSRKSFSLPEYQLLLAYAKFKNKKYDEAKQVIDQISQQNRASRVGLNAEEIKAEVYEEQGQLDTAAFIYKGIIKDDPSRGRAHWGLGRFYLARGDTRRAIAHMEKTAMLWPKHTASRYNLGVLYLGKENEDLAKAASWLFQAYNINKGDPELLEQIGVLFERKGQIPEAIKNWTRATEIKKDATIANEKLGFYALQVVDNLVEQKKYEEALKKIEKGGKSFSDQPKIVLRRGIIYRHLGRFEKAVVDLQGFLAANPKDATALREVGICYLNLKSVDQAANYFTRAIAEEPNNGANHAWMAFVLEARGELPQARDSWKKATELIKDSGELEKAIRRLASVENRIKKQEKQDKEKRKDF